jgi:hypothetical protein
MEGNVGLEDPATSRESAVSMTRLKFSQANSFSNI